jgi:hypothetical protein
VERVNAFLGYGAIGHIRIVQAPVRNAPKTGPAVARLSSEDEAKVTGSVAGVEHDRLREALGRLGRGVMADRRRPQ